MLKKLQSVIKLVVISLIYALPAVAEGARKTPKKVVKKQQVKRKKVTKKRGNKPSKRPKRAAQGKKRAKKTPQKVSRPTPVAPGVATSQPVVPTQPAPAYIITTQSFSGSCPASELPVQAPAQQAPVVPSVVQSLSIRGNLDQACTPEAPTPRSTEQELENKVSEFLRAGTQEFELDGAKVTVQRMQDKIAVTIKKQHCTTTLTAQSMPDDKLAKTIAQFRHNPFMLEFLGYTKPDPKKVAAYKAAVQKRFQELGEAFKRVWQPLVRNVVNAQQNVERTVIDIERDFAKMKQEFEAQEREFRKREREFMERERTALR